MQAANRVIFNTGITYVRMLITVGISLYTTRLVLNGLGIVDYGIYNLVAGVITMLSFLNAAMTTSTQRYLSFYQGKKDLKYLREVFSNSMLLHIFIGIIMVFILEISGLFLFDKVFNIPVARLVVAKSLYHLMSGTVFFTVISVPFIALLNAHENMLWVSLVNIIEVLLKLICAFLLFVVTNNKLFFYGLALAMVSIISLLLYIIFCKKKYQECTFRLQKYKNKVMLKELTSFAGWNLFGALCGVGKNQGIAVILNIFLGTVANAAYGIANQVSGQMNFFSASLLRALNPQIMKSEGQGDRKRMLRISMMASKFGFFLFAVIAIPCIFEMPSILKLWLKNVPENTVIFCNLLLISILANQLTIGLQSAIQATGNIKRYQAVVGSILLLNLPVSYGLLYIGFPSYSVFISFIIIELLACIFRLFFLEKITNLSIKEYCKNVFIKEIAPVLSLIVSCYILVENIKWEYRFIITIIISSIVFIICIYFTGLCKDEKEFIKVRLTKLKKII